MANVRIHRSFGPYSAVTLIALSIFLCGCISVFLPLCHPVKSYTQLLLGQIYFVGMVIIWLAGVAAGIIYMVGLHDKIVHYCADLPYGCDPDSIQKTYNIVLPLSIVSSIFLVLLFLYFIRLIYKWLAALEEVYDHSSTGLTPVVHFIGPWLPNYTVLLCSAFKVLYSWCCLSSCCDGDCCQSSCCDGDCGSGDCCTCPSCSTDCCGSDCGCSGKDACLGFGAFLCIGLTVLCVVIAFLPSEFGPGWQLFCVIWETVIQILFHKDHDDTFTVSPVPVH